MWFRESSITLDFEDLADYLATFHSLPGTKQLDFDHAPKIMLVLCDHEKEDYKTGSLIFDLKPLLNLRAVCTWLSVNFKSRWVAEHDVPHKDCDVCNQCIRCEGRCELVEWEDLLNSHPDYDDMFDSADSFSTGHNCPHLALLDDVKSDFLMEYNYLEALNGFLNNRNEIWLESIAGDLRHGWMKVECTMGPEDKFPTIYIQFAKGHAPPIFQEKALKYAACQYLTDVGIIDLWERTELDFVVGIGTGKVPQHSPRCKTPSPTYNQIRICGHTYEEPAGIVRPAKIGDGK